MKLLVSYILTIGIVLTNSPFASICCCAQPEQKTVIKVKPTCSHCSEASTDCLSGQNSSGQNSSDQNQNPCPCNNCPQKVEDNVQEESKNDLFQQVPHRLIWSTITTYSDVTADNGDSYHVVRLSSDQNVAQGPPIRILHCLFLC